MPRNVTYTLEKAQDDEGGMIARPGPAEQATDNGHWGYVVLVIVLAWLVISQITTLGPTGF